MEDLRGRQLGPYKIVAPIGQGGMGVVYKAYQSNMNRHVALKILPIRFTSDPDFVKRFKQEAELIAQLEHAYIVPVFDFGEIEGNIYISMRLVEGGTLADRLKRREPLSIAQIRRVISQVGEALDYAHSQGVIHRDVKPNNILVDQRNNCLLTDFGIAKILAASTHLTQEGAGTAGTPAYMSPEQIMGRKPDGRTDIYSLGVVLFEMATGTIPFDGDAPTAIFVKHIKDPLPGPRERNPNLPAPVEKVILKALEKQPNDRYATAGEMTKALRAATPATSFSESTQEDEPLFAPTPDKIPSAMGQKTAETPTPPPMSRSTPPPPPQPLTRPEPAQKPATAWWIGGIAVAGVALLGLLICGVIVVRPLLPSPTSSTATPRTIIEVTPTIMDTPQLNPGGLMSVQATAIAQNILIFEDDFSSNINGWDEEEPPDEFGSYRTLLTNDKYHMSLHSKQGVFYRKSPAKLLTKHFLFSIEATIAEADAGLGDASIGLAFRENVRGDYYTIEFFNDGSYRFSLMKDDSWKTLQEWSPTTSFNLVLGNPNVFGVMAVGSTFTFYANDQKLGSVTDSTLAEAGEIALAISVDKKDQVLAVDFDNLLIREVPLELNVTEIAATATARSEAIATVQAWPTATAAARATEIAQIPIFFEDDFSANNSNWEQGPYSDKKADIVKEFIAGKYRVSANSKQGVFHEIWLPNSNYKNFWLEVETKIIDISGISETSHDGGIDLLFRKNNNDYYDATFYNDGSYLLSLYQNGDWTYGDSKESGVFELKPGFTNRFAIHVKGSSITFYANSQDLVTIKDINLSEAGQIGLGITINEANQTMVVEFDNLTIKQISP